MQGFFRLISNLLDLAQVQLARLERAADSSPKLVSALLLIFVLACFAELFLDWILGPGREFTFGQLRFNYQGGFVRRGLLGELVWRLERLTSVPANYFLGAIFAAMYCALFSTVLHLLNERVPSATWRISLFLAPVGVLFPWQDSGAFMRAEVVALLLLAVHSRFSALRGFPLAVLLSLSVLVHELQALLLPFHAVLLLHRRYSVAPLLLPLAVCGVTAMHVGNADIEAAICASWGGRGCPGYLTWGFRENFQVSVDSINADGLNYLSGLMLGLAPSIFLMHIYRVPALLRNSWWLATGAAAGLFLSGSDFGRWINIISIHGLLTTIALTQGRLGVTPTLPSFMLLPTFRWCVASGYALLWYVPHIGSPGLRRGLAYRYLSYSLIHEPLYWLLLPLALLPLLTLLLFWRQLRQLNTTQTA